MIKFFRRIRQKLLEQGNLKRYLIYAIGEILLVIIGILIALFINDWRNDLNAQKTEALILESLHIEFSAGNVAIQEFIEKNENIIDTNKSLLSYCLNIETEFEEPTFDSLFYHAAWSESLRLNQGVFKELLNTGNLSKLSDTKLRVLLSSWDELLEEVGRADQVGLDYLQDKLMNYFDQNLSWAMMSKDDKLGLSALKLKGRDRSMDKISVAKDLEFENFIFNQIWFTQRKINGAKELLALNIEIIDEIQKAR
jgi:hypothetical protein